MLGGVRGKNPGANVAAVLYRYATPVPIPISVNMLGLRLTSERQKRWKNGQPPQSTTGVASANSIHGSATQESKPVSEVDCTPRPGIMWYMSSNIKGTVRARLTQKRRVMSRNSGFSSVDAVTVRGSSAMLQIGHAPGAGRTISG